MKKLIFTPFFIFICIITISGQILVRESGKVVVGQERDHDNDRENMITIAVNGPYGNNRAGGKLGFGDFSSANAWNVFVGEYNTTDTDKLWLHGRAGTYLTCGENANSLGIICYYNSLEGNKFTFNCPVYSQGSLLTSDERLKTNVKK